MNTRERAGQVESGWEDGAPLLDAYFTPVRLAARPRRSPSLESDPESCRWKRELLRDALLSTTLYALGHLLFTFHGMRGAITTITSDLEVAILMFLLGTTLLWKLTCSLHDPRAARHPGSAGFCLITGMLLSLSPLLWWFIYAG